jgi:thiamine-phosphate pyrophosphorylase
VSAGFELPIICLITKGEATPENFPQKKNDILNIIRSAVENRIGIVQVREKRLSAKMLFELAEGAVKIAKNSSTRILINERADIALAAGADGVHLPADSLSPVSIREKFPKKFIIGISTHSLLEAESAVAQGADFIVLGPVFETPGKGRPLGLDTFGDVCARLRPFPVIALGGIDAANSRKALAAGGSGIAAIRFLNDPKNLEHHPGIG